MPSIDVISVTSAPYNAVGDGIADDRAAIQAALDAGATSGLPIYFPPGVYSVSRAGGSAFSLDLSNKKGVKLLGERGRSWLRHPTGMPNATVAILRLNECSTVTIEGLGFDGNWGNAVTRIHLSSDDDVLPQSTIHVEDTSAFPSNGTFYVVTANGAEAITYTAKTSSTFTGCSGGTGRLHFGQVVGFVDDKTGINHTTQSDPHNYGVMIRGGTEITVSNCLFRDVYGDAIWVGASTVDDSTYATGARWVRILNCDADVCARDGIALAQKCSDVVIRGCRFTNTYSSPFDTEPVEQGVNNVVIDSCHFSGWWNPGNPARSGNLGMTIAGGKVVSPNEGNFARNYRVVNNTIRGGIGIYDAVDVVVANNRILCDWDGYGYAPISINMFCDGIQIDQNYIYDRVGDEGGGVAYHLAAIQANVYAAANFNGQPAGVSITRNVIKVRNNRHGIMLRGTGSYAYGTGAMQPGETGAATTVTATTVVDALAAWTTNQWMGYRVRIGAATATVVSNTETTLTLWVEAKYTSAWRTPTGESIDTPVSGNYQLFAVVGIAEICDNKIDCSDDGRGGGGFGVYLYTYRAGMRAKVNGNVIRNADTDAINIKCVDTNRALLSLELTDNKAWDDQLTPTCTSTVRFESPVHIDKLVMRNNQAGDGVASSVSGLSSGAWLVNDGTVQQWAGYGSPEGSLSASMGATYVRVDGGPGSTLYVKESGTGNVGWSAK